jgi:hypothetical protein
MQIDVKRVSKWSQKRCKNTSKINAKTGTEQNQGYHKKSADLWFGRARPL